jgi:hypothetical protein
LSRGAPSGYFRVVGATVSKSGWTHIRPREPGHTKRGTRPALDTTTDSVSHAIRQLPVADTHLADTHLLGRSGRHHGVPAGHGWIGMRGAGAAFVGVRNQTNTKVQELVCSPHLVCPGDLKCRRGPGRGTAASPRDWASATGRR